VTKENKNHTYQDREPATLFRAAECIELAQTAPTPEKRELYLKMASVWHQMAQRWEKKVNATRPIDKKAAPPEGPLS
jgi:hypothetical protein